jgi:hypothetical protein
MLDFVRGFATLVAMMIVSNLQATQFSRPHGTTVTGSHHQPWGTAGLEDVMSSDKRIPCPRCGKPYTTVSLRCRACYTIDRRAASLDDRFWSHVRRSNPNECWPWMASRSYFGYGRVNVGGEMVAAHRVAWELTNGPIPPGLCVCHKCDNPPCCNPAHLFPGSKADNTHDMMKKGRRPHIAIYGESHVNAKLTWAIIPDIRARRASGEHVADIAARYGVNPTAISHVLSGRTWREEYRPNKEGAQIPCTTPREARL